MKINPLDDRVVVRPNEAEETTAGGIVLPDAAKEKQQRGTVLAVGPGRLLESGERSAVSVKVGDQVLFGKYGGTEIEVDGEDVKILRESDILAKLVRIRRSSEQRFSLNRCLHTILSEGCPGKTLVGSQVGSRVSF